VNLIGFKWWFFKSYAWIGVGLTVLIAVLLERGDWKAEESIAGLVAIFGYFHFVQNQRLEELRLFKDLFTAFNAKYDELNEDLARVQQGAWTPEMERKVIDYFNLCAEEYLFFKQGYILPEAWVSWRKGMRQYLGVDRVRKLWELEAKTDSYYGLTLEVILET
jgi:hypothetical protein